MARTSNRQHAATAAFTPIEWPAHVRLASGRTKSKPVAKAVNPEALAGQRSRHVRGAVAEWAAAMLLIVKGYRILGRRTRTPQGEIDLIAVRGKRLAFVEVKYRRTVAEASSSITGMQAGRIANAAEQWVWRHPRYREHEIGLDAILVAPGCLPRHAVNALQPA
jgi:putative endonuclease